MQNTAQGPNAFFVEKEKDNLVNCRFIYKSKQILSFTEMGIVYRFSEILVLFVLMTISVLFGAVQAWVWSIYTTLIYFAFIAYIWQEKSLHKALSISNYTVASGFFFAYTLFTCLPMPYRLLCLLSPVRCELLKQTQMLTGLDTAWPSLSYAPFQSLAWWAFLFGLYLLFFLLKQFYKSSRMLRFSLWIVLGLSVIQGLYGILQALIPNLGVLWVNSYKNYLGDARGTWINRNHFAGYMEMMLPLLLGFTLSRAKWRPRIKFRTFLQSDQFHVQCMLLLSLVVMVLALLFSKSRAGILSLFCGMGTFFFMTKRKGPDIPKQLWVVLCVFSCLAFLFALRIGFDPVINRFLGLSHGISRLNYWRDSLSIITDHPLGIGLATFKFVFPVYDVSSMSDAVMPRYLHNDVLQLLVETGWPGSLSLLGAYLAFMSDNFRRIWHMDFYTDPQRFFTAVGAFSGLVSISIHSFFDFNLQIPANALYFVVLLAMLHAYSETPVH